MKKLEFMAILAIIILIASAWYCAYEIINIYRIVYEVKE